MSFTVQYARFFSVRVKDKSTGRGIRALQFTPTSTSRQLLETFHLVFRHRNSGFDVYYKSYPVASEPLPAAIEDKVRFSFAIRVKDRSLFTEYEPESPALPQLYLDNLKANGTINNSAAGNLTSGTEVSAGDLVRVRTQTFQQRTEIPSANAPTEWRVKEPFPPQDVLQNVPVGVPAGTGVKVVFVTINDPLKHSAQYIAADGPYLLATDKANPPSAMIYLSDELGASGVNGVLDIHWNSIQSSVDPQTGKEYQIIFKPKQN